MFRSYCMPKPAVNIVNLEEYRATALRKQDERLTPTPTEVDFSPRSNRGSNLDELYSGETRSTKNLVRAASMLSRSSERLFAARQFIIAGDIMAADTEIMLVQSELPVLFACAEPDSGFAAIALAMHYAIQSAKGRALNEAQINAFQSCVEAMKDSPFSRFEDALAVV